MGIGSVLLFFAAPATVQLIAPGFDEPTKALYLDLFRIMLLTPILFAASITLGGAAVLAADMRTGPAPVLLAAFVVTAVVTWTVRLLYDSGRPRHGRLAAR